jgi:hypothetical protein
MPTYATSARQSDAGRAADRVWLLDLEWSGRTYRLSTSPLVMSDDTGTARQYVGGILGEPSVSRSSNRSGVDDVAAAAPLAVSIDAADIAGRIAGGSRLQEARGWLYEVYIDKTGAVLQSWSQRIAHVVNGRVTRPVFDDPDQPVTSVSFTLEEQPTAESRLLLDPAGIIDATTWDEAEGKDADGKPYPLIIGSPGVFRFADGTLARTSGSPAYVVSYTTASATLLLIAGHPVVATNVRVWDSSGATDTLAVITRTDGRGRLVSVVNIAGSALDRSLSQFYVQWYDGGGLESPFRPGAALEGAGDLLRYFGLLSGTDCDLAAFAAEADALNRYKIAGFYSDPGQQVWDALSELVEVLPGVGIRRDSNGLRPVVRRLDYPDEGTAGHIYARTEDPQTLASSPSPDFAPASPWTFETSEDDHINAMSILFARRLKTGRFRRYLTVTPRPDPLNINEVATSYAIFGESRTQSTQAEALELPLVYDETTAGIIAAETVRQRAFPYRSRSFVASMRWGWLRVNEVYLLTDDVYTSVQVEVVSKEPTPGGYVYTLTLDDDPVRLAGKTV